ncbi:hypothetical protein ACOME3_009760 [Neoechinorhynchus agilis]
MSRFSERLREYRIESVNLVGMRSLKLPYDQVDCAICQKSINDNCDTCEQQQQSDYMLICSVVQGVCGHAFHQCCSKLSIELTCPLCSADWKIERTIPLSHMIRPAL